MTEPLKLRRLTLKRVRDVLKASDRPLSDEELAERLDCSAVTIRDSLYRWVQVAAGVRSVRHGAKEYLGWSYVPPEPPCEYEPITPTIEQLEAQIHVLKQRLATQTPDSIRDS